MQDCSTSLIQSVTSFPSCNRGALELEVGDELQNMIVHRHPQPGVHARSPHQHGFPPSFEGLVFFRPVDGNLSHHTFLGTQFQSDFDFLAQILSIISCERDSSGAMVRVVLGSVSGDPKLMRMSRLPYQQLASKLMIWSCGQSGFHVAAKHNM